ncbi:hypothetical protein EIN_397610 [Entamoeba invadens IP1]|uniref:Uncharacterized protein n=1 Tax=Entamoeba invadens IP1 TaxID=370355 RepID=A0A0A1UDH1_ENTIV|nr:hypothetical protein EIN_397610 [Entamoeba invadens IP1]ELP91861.1 hypothetical protein EIN_397610 [Entamoeba invadens IP1]|eukprot:XP_004258632.1 hypothetical protein EIN_397610 [Entamoeba invadens IP1]
MNEKSMFDSEVVRDANEMARLTDVMYFGNIKKEAHILAADEAMLLQRQKVLFLSNELLAQAKISEEKEAALRIDLNTDKKTEIIKQTPLLFQLSAHLDQLIKQRKDLLKKHEALSEKLDGQIYEVKKQAQTQMNFKRENDLTGKIVSMKGDLDVGVLICNKEIIPFDMRRMTKEERQRCLCEIVLKMKED